MRVKAFVKYAVMLLVIAVASLIVPTTSKAATEEIGTTDRSGNFYVCKYFDAEEPWIIIHGPSGKTYMGDEDFAKIENYPQETIYYISGESAGTWTVEYEDGKSSVVHVSLVEWYDDSPVTINSASYEEDGDYLKAHINASYAPSNYLNCYVYALAIDGAGNIIGQTEIGSGSFRTDRDETISYIHKDSLPDGDYKIKLEIVGSAGDGSESSNVIILDGPLNITGHNTALDESYIKTVYDIEGIELSIDWSLADNNASKWVLNVYDGTTGEEVYSNEYDQYTKADKVLISDDAGTAIVVLTARNRDSSYTTIRKEVSLKPELSVKLESGLFTNSSAAEYSYIIPAGEVATLSITLNNNTQNFRLTNGGTFTVQLDGMATNEVVLEYGLTETTRYRVVNKISVDNIGPILDLFAVADIMYVSRKDVIISGSTEPGALLKVNGTAITIDDEGMFSYATDLALGENTLEFVAEDKAGNRTIRSLKAVYAATGDNGSETVIEADNTDAKKQSFFEKYLPLIVSLGGSIIVCAAVALSGIVSGNRSRKKGYGKLGYSIRLVLAEIKAALGLVAVGFAGKAAYTYFRAASLKKQLVGSELVSTIQNNTTAEVVDMINEHGKILAKIKAPIIVAAVCLVVMIAAFVVQGIIESKLAKKKNNM